MKTDSSPSRYEEAKKGLAVDSKTSIRTDVVSNLDSKSSLDEHDTMENVIKESEKRAKLNRISNENIDHNDRKKMSNKQIVIEGLTKELPKDIRSALIWNNVIAILVSSIYLTVVCTQLIFYSTDSEVKYFLAILSLVSSIVGQSLSWFGTVHSVVGCLGLGILFLIINILTSTVVIVQHSKKIASVYEEQLLFSLIVLPIILFLSIGTVVLNLMHITKIQTTRHDMTSNQSPKESQELAKTQSPDRNQLDSGFKF